MEFQVGNVFFILELLVAELIFLYPTPKRTAFPLRLLLGFLGAVLLSGFLPAAGHSSAMVYLFRSVAIFLISLAAIHGCFSLELPKLFSLCMAGYGTQHMAFRIALILRRPGLLEFDRQTEIVIVTAVYLFVLFTYGRFSARYACWKNRDSRLDFVSALILCICILLSRLPQLLGEEYFNTTANVYCVLCCSLSLFIQFNVHRMMLLSNENGLLERLRQEERKQYLISKSAIEDINIKIHDLKHKLISVQEYLPSEEAESLHRDISTYDAMMHTGNETLDILMTEKVRQCQRQGIRLSFAGDGKVLSFMRTMDIYSLFGNAVDNAMEAVEKLPQEQKVIDVSIARRGEFVFLSFVNYMQGKPEFLDGLPQTTKTEDASYHGFGVKSMRNIAASYGGELTAEVSEGCFYLNIYLHDPAQ